MHLELLLLILCAATLTLGASKSRQQVLSDLLKNYDPNVYPNDQDGTQTVATVQVTISDVFQTNDRTEELELTMYLRMAWNDPRLQFENETNITFTNIELTGDKTNKLWMPDLFFYDERRTSSHGVTGQEKLIYIYQDGNISFSERISMTTECIMNFEKFPFDTQKCKLHIESYAYTTKLLVLKWAPQNEAVQNEDPNTPYFEITNIEINSGIHTWSSFSIYSDKRDFSYLNAILTLERKSAAYGFMYFGTYPFYVSLAFFSFGFKDATPRFTIVSTAAAGIALQWIAVYANLPPTAHFTVLDRWILGHMLIIWIIIFYNVVFHLLVQMNEGKLSRFDHKSKSADVKSKKNKPVAENIQGQQGDFESSINRRALNRSESRWNFDDVGRDGVKISFSDVYYLHTYLQAKFPDFKWPDLPVQNVLTSREEQDFKKKRAEYVVHMKQLLKPSFWEEHNEIQEVIRTFCKKGIQTSKMMYIVFLVDTAGRFTAPDLLVFIILLITYGTFMPCVLKYVSDWSWWSVGGAIFLSLISFVIKYKKMKVPKLYDRTKETENNDPNNIRMEQQQKPEDDEQTSLLRTGTN